MHINLEGRVRNSPLPHSKALFPVFEAVINSIHAVHEARQLGQLGPSEGSMSIRLERDTSAPRMKADQGDQFVLNPVVSVTIADDGVGFTETHFKSFCTSDTTQKLAMGGRGIGRLLWLKAFERAQVRSTYFDENGAACTRMFDFLVGERGVENERLDAAAEGAHRYTEVRLERMKNGYRDSFPRQSVVIARRLIEHCLEYFVVGDTPRMVLEDPGHSEPIILNELFTSEVRATSAVNEFDVKGVHLAITHLLIAAGHGIGHRLHFCADRRVVRSEPLDKLVPNLESHLVDSKDGRAVVYAGYVAGAYLDESVSPDRTHFDIVSDGSQLGLNSAVGWGELAEGSVGEVRNYLAPFTDSLKQVKEEQIRRYVFERAPRYRPLIRHRPTALDAIPPHLSDDKLDLELYKQQQAYQRELRSVVPDVMAVFQGDKAEADFTDYQSSMRQFLEEWNEQGMAQLAEYVAHRKATLQFLQATLRRRPEGRYSLESAVHEIVFPLRTTSDDVRWDQMNLWMIDEKLAYHYYLASDRRLNQVEPLSLSSDDRPDLLIFDNPAAFVDTEVPFGSITLVEFKRPGRAGYSDDDNPIRQVYGYVRRIRTGSALDRHGRPISIAPETRFYAYIICDLLPKVREYAADANLRQMPDGLGFFGWNSELGVYVEVLSFDKLVGDAQRRNQILFDKLENAVPS